MFLDLPDGFKELFLAGHELGEVELSAELRAALEETHAMAALGRSRRRRQTCRTRTHHRNVLSKTEKMKKIRGRRALKMERLFSSWK